jgi:hypothetical protein
MLIKVISAHSSGENTCLAQRKIRGVFATGVSLFGPLPGPRIDDSERGSVGFPRARGKDVQRPLSKTLSIEFADVVPLDSVAGMALKLSGYAHLRRGATSRSFEAVSSQASRGVLLKLQLCLWERSGLLTWTE